MIVSGVERNEVPLGFLRFTEWRRESYQAEPKWVLRRSPAKRKRRGKLNLEKLFPRGSPDPRGFAKQKPFPRGDKVREDCMKNEEMLVQLLVGNLRLVQTPIDEIEGRALAALFSDSPNKFQTLASLATEAVTKLHFFVDDNVRAENVIASIVAATIWADPITTTEGAISAIQGPAKSFLCCLHDARLELKEPLKKPLLISHWTRGVACGFLLLFQHMIIRPSESNSEKTHGVVTGAYARQFVERVSVCFAREIIGWGGVEPAGPQLSGIISSMIVNWMKGINWCSQLAEEILIQSKKVKLSEFGTQILSEMADKMWYRYDISYKRDILLLGAHSPGPAKNG